MTSLLLFDHYERARLKKVAALCTPGSVLDLGYAQYPNPYFRGVMRTGVDLARPAGGSEYEEELVGDAGDLESCVAGRTFDNVVAGELVEHVERPYDFLRGLRPFIAPGGRLIISTPNPVSWPCVVFEWFRSRRFYYTTEHKYYFAPRWVERMLDVCGYRIIAVKGVGLLAPFVTLPCPSGVSYQVIFCASPEGR